MTIAYWAIAILLGLLGWQVFVCHRLKKQLQLERNEQLRLKKKLESVRQDLAEVNARRKKLLAASTQALIIVEKDFSISSANKVARRLFGKPAKGVSLMGWTRQHRLQELVEQTLENKKTPPTYLTADDQVLEAHARAIKSQKIVIAVALAIHDVTELQQASRARRNFVTNISHELRTPLASLQLLTETLLNGAIDDKEMAINLVNKMMAQVDTLSQLAQEVLDLSLIESGKTPLRLGSYSLQSIMLTQIDRLLPQAERKHLMLDMNIDSNVSVLVDQTLIGRVITNLIHNAIKFTDTGGVTIEAQRLNGESNGPKMPEGDWVKVSVIDSGVGIPLDELPHIFERFYKIDQARSGQNSGTGLGLAIAKHIVEAHGGLIWAESGNDSGATFHFVVPTEDEIEEAA